MRKLLIALCLVLLLTGLPKFALADCMNPVRPEGTFIFNADQNVPQICTAAGWVALGVLNPGAGGGGCASPTGVEGELLYNSAYHTPQYCDGDDWIAMIGQVDGCTAPSDCSSVGDLCTDGSLFAGFMSYNDGSCDIVYVTDNNQSTNAMWKNATGTDDISTDDPVDGRVNAANRSGVITDFPAFDLCESNTYHGKSDWYLPAQAELNLLWLNRAAIDANAAGGFTSNGYWSSTEQYGDTSGARNQDFDDGDQLDHTKTNNYDVRCIRRVASPGASGGGSGGGCTAPSDCSNVGNVCTDGSLFAGFVLYGTSCEALFVTDNNQSTATQWKNATGTNDINPDSPIDGRANHANRSGTLSNFPAFDLCESNTYHGKSDWYLPAEVELNVLQQNKSAINANAAGNFTSNFYWTSTETDSTYAWYVGFSLGRQDGEQKDDNALDVRCVRRN